MEKVTNKDISIVYLILTGMTLMCTFGVFFQKHAQLNVILVSVINVTTFIYCLSSFSNFSVALFPFTIGILLESLIHQVTLLENGSAFIIQSLLGTMIVFLCFTTTAYFFSNKILKVLAPIILSWSLIIIIFHSNNAFWLYSYFALFGLYVIFDTIYMYDRLAKNKNYKIHALSFLLDIINIFEGFLRLYLKEKSK